MKKTLTSKNSILEWPLNFISGLHVSSLVRHNQLGLTKNYTSCSNPWGGQFYTKMSGYSLFTIIIINTVGRFSTRVNSCHSTGIELNTHQFDLFRYFSGGVMTCNHIQSHKRELGLTTSTVVFKKVNIFHLQNEGFFKSRNVSGCVSANSR